MNRHQKILIIVLLVVISSFWLYAMLSFSDIDFGGNVLNVIKESGQDSKMDNSIPIRQSNSARNSFARFKRETNGGKIAFEPAVEMTKSSQQIQFTPDLGYYYGISGSIDPYQMTVLPQFPSMQPAYGNSFAPGYMPFHPYGHIACFLNPEHMQNPYAPFYCTYIPPMAPPVTYQFPAIPGIPEFNMAGRKSDDSADSQLNPHESLLRKYYGKNNGIEETYTRDCPTNYYECNDDKKCIPKQKWCDGNVDCADQSDENQCTCRDKIDPKHLCDHYFDCDNGEDELGCLGCSLDSISCNSLNNGPDDCFKIEERCDGIWKCKQGEDELDCGVLTKLHAAVEPWAFPTGLIDGFLKRNYGGQWYHVCGKADKWAEEVCENKLGHVNKKPTCTFATLPNYRELGLFILQDGSIIKECPNQILHVACSDPSDPRTASSNSKGKVSRNRSMMNSSSTAFAKARLQDDRLYTEFDLYPQVCPLNYRSCNDGSKCIPNHQWCDNKIDCLDSSDEKKCSCRNRIDSRRICDTYLDCPNGEDEFGCFGCPRDSMSCHDRIEGPSNCFKMEDRCDGNSKCANARDDEDCMVLTYLNDDLQSEGIFPTGYTHGYLTRNYKSNWYRVCGLAEEWAWETCLHKLKLISEKPQMSLTTSPEHRRLGPFLQEDGSMVDECPNDILHVKCPEPTDPRNTPAKIRSKANQDKSVAIPSSSSNPIVGIVGGRPSAAGAWPFVVAINKNGQFHCGGAVVDPYWILSAAHCFFGSQNNYYEIEAGMLRRHSYSPSRQIRQVKNIVIHSKFNPEFLSYDIAMIKLDQPLYFNERLEPVTLPRGVSFSGWKMEPNPGATCVALGWGALVEGGPDPDHLQEVAVPIVECKHSRDRNVAEICAGYKQGGRDACQGDSGGPLMCRDSNLEWYIGGVVSHGVGCARVNEPGAYTKVSYFVDWIKDVTNGRTSMSTSLNPLNKCPGFICHRPYHRCLAARKRCDGVVDCLEAEDENNCPPASLIYTAANFLKGLVGQPLQQQVQQKPDV